MESRLLRRHGCGAHGGNTAFDVQRAAAVKTTVALARGEWLRHVASAHRVNVRENGQGSAKRSQVGNNHARRAAYAIGTIGLPDSCESRMAPGLNLRRGPCGPSGVMAGDTPSFMMAS